MNFLRIKVIDDLIIGLLNHLVNILGSYGLAIIATTIIVRLLMLPLSIKQEKSMRKQNELQPKVNALNKKYPKKGPEYQKELMELYKTENANPLLGCLPLLIQFPIFIALYNAFNTANLDGATNFLWFNLTQPDRFLMIGSFAINLLPLISTALQVIQQKLMMTNTGEKDEKMETMQKTMLAMPLIMLFLFYNFSSALNLYFLVNTLLGVIQSYVFIQLRKKNNQK